MSRTVKSLLPGTRRTNHETTPTRRFDATVGAITAKESVADALTEDVDLTDYLMWAWYELIHLSPTPVPRCPHCDGLRIRPDRPSGKSKLDLSPQNCPTWKWKISALRLAQFPSRS
ncbi:hypothetical protein DO64_4785 [Burkholderia pseudomallei]|nr:hypothetical protein DO64_4785 [Burkholderia pseudomallei]